MKHSESSGDGCDCVKCTLVVSETFLKALKEIAKHPQTQAQTVNSTVHVVKNPKKLFTPFQEFKANFFVADLHPSLSSLSASLLSHTNSTASWEMPTWPELQQTEGGQRGKPCADTNLK